MGSAGDTDNQPPEHPADLVVGDEDIVKLVMSSCILAGARAFTVSRPALVSIEEVGDSSEVLELQSHSNLMYDWARPRRFRLNHLEDEIDRSELPLAEVSRYCELLEPYFLPIDWQAGRIAVAIGSLMSYALATDPVQAYLALMTIFEALLSTDRTELTHQICERAACLLETSEDARYHVYLRMKQLYKTRSMFIHGDVSNKPGLITLDRARFDAKFAIVPEHDMHELFDLCLSLFRVVLQKPELARLLEERNTKALAEWYTRKVLR